MALFEGYDRADAEARNFVRLAVNDLVDNGAAMLRAAEEGLAKASAGRDLFEQMRITRIIGHIKEASNDKIYAAAPCANCGKPRSEHHAVTWSKPFDMHTVIGGPPEPVYTLAVLCPTAVFKNV